MNNIFDLPYFKSIKSKVVILVSMLIALAMVLITLLVIYVAYTNMSKQMYALLENRGYSIHERFEQRIDYLVSNSVLLTKNDLMVNALTDINGRKTYLPPLVKNFMEDKDVASLNIVDVDGRAIFQTQKEIPKYNKSPQLRSALALGETAYYIQKDDNNLVVVSPIEYYNTTQGAAVVVFEIEKLAKRIFKDEKDIYIRLLKDEDIMFSYHFNESLEYQSYKYIKSKDTSFLKQLDIHLEVGIPSAIYMAPLKDIVIKLLIIGILFVILGIVFSNLLAKTISDPVIELYRRVKNISNKKEVFCSPIGTHDELEELAKAFDERSLMLQHQAQHDALTKLPNRVLFIDRLNQSINNAPRNKESFAVFFLDLDHFKEINDSFGHSTGDELLIIIGKYLESILRESDSVVRMGGDEFTILLNNLKNGDGIVDVLQKIMNLFSEPFKVQHHQFYIKCSIGVAVYPQNGTSAEVLLKNADAAMYKAKDLGRNN